MVKQREKGESKNIFFSHTVFRSWKPNASSVYSLYVLWVLFYENRARHTNRDLARCCYCVDFRKKWPSLSVSRSFLLIRINIFQERRCLVCQCLNNTKPNYIFRKDFPTWKRITLCHLGRDTNPYLYAFILYAQIRRGASFHILFSQCVAPFVNAEFLSVTSGGADDGWVLWKDVVAFVGY